MKPDIIPAGLRQQLVETLKGLDQLAVAFADAGLLLTIQRNYDTEDPSYGAYFRGEVNQRQVVHSDDQ